LRQNGKEIAGSRLCFAYNARRFQPHGGDAACFLYEEIKMMFTPRKLFSKSLNAALAALLLATAAPVWADNTTQFKQALTAYQAGNYEQAFHLWQPLAQQGDAEAQFNLGVMYENGQGVTQDYRQAAAWYQKVANQGDARAQFNLGLMYNKGRGVAQDYRQAAAWYQKAANQGDTGAQNNLGLMYSNGHGVAQDYRQAMAWYQKAANQGNAEAQYNLGVMYANGRGVAQDYRQAKALWQKVLAQPDTPDNAEAKANARISLAQLIIMGIR